MTKNQEIDVKSLANLARLEVSDEELKELNEQIPEILSFVARIQEVSVDASKTLPIPEQKNVMREDVNPHESGEYTETLLSAAPHREGDYVQVKQVLKSGKHT